MPGPDPNTVWFDEYDGEPTVTFEHYLWSGNTGHRKARALTMLRRLQRGDWICRWCGDELPEWRRADAKYCCEGCRKRAARASKKAGP